MDIHPISPAGANTMASAATPAADAQAPVRQVIAAVHQVNKAELMGQGRQLAFSRDPETRQPIIQIVDQDSGEVIDQIPPETVLQLAEQIK